jgi:transposase
MAVHLRAASGGASVDVFRARLILGLADGESHRQIMASLQTTASTISRWFEQDGIDRSNPRGS